MATKKISLRPICPICEMVDNIYQYIEDKRTDNFGYLLREVKLLIYRTYFKKLVRNIEEIHIDEAVSQLNRIHQEYRKNRDKERTLARLFEEVRLINQRLHNEMVFPELSKFQGKEPLRLFASARNPQFLRGEKKEIPLVCRTCPYLIRASSRRWECHRQWTGCPYNSPSS